MLDIDSIYDPVKDAVPPIDADELQAALECEGAPRWLADAVVEAVCNNDPGYLIRQVSKHIPNWKKP